MQERVVIAGFEPWRSGLGRERLLDAVCGLPLRGPAELVDGELRREIGALDLAVSVRRELGLEVVAAREAADRRGQLEDRCLLAPPQVVWARARRVLGCEQPRHHVVDVDVVARLGALAEDRGTAPVAREVAEDRHHAGLQSRVLARAVDVAESGDDAVDTPRAPVELDVPLGRVLALPVDGVGLAGGVLAEGQFVGATGALSIYGASC